MRKIKDYFRTKPEISISTLLIILILLKYVTPTMLLFMTPMMMGSVTPEVPYEKTQEIYENMAENLAGSFADAMKKMYVAGQGLSDHSLILRVFFYGVIWTTYMAVIGFFFYVIRFAIYYMIPKKHRKDKPKPKPQRRSKT